MKTIFALLLISVLAPSAVAQSGPLAGFVVCLDPGHTSETSAGTQSRDGKLTERHVNWVVAQDLKPLLEAEGAQVKMTKTSENQVVTNRHRAEIASSVHANLFLRLHCDAASDAGLATFYPDRQGRAHGRTGPSFAVIAASRRAASAFHPAVIAALGGTLADRGIKGDSATGIGAKQGALTGSIFSEVPALTIEMVVLTDSHDYRLIRTRAGQHLMARALLAGVEADARAGR